jgi:hypothetical protein
MGVDFNQSILQGLDRLVFQAEQRCRYTKSEQNQSKRVKRLHEAMLDAHKVSVGLSVDVPGDVVLKNLRRAIRRFRLTSQQLIFSELFIASQLKSIYKQDYAAHELRIKEENDLDELFQYALICCPRRFGKTYFTAIFCACLLVCVPGTKIVLFSPGKRQSTMIMNLIRQNLKHLKQWHDWEITKNNVEELVVNVDGDERSCMGLPAKEETTRGTGGTCVICEEAAVMPPKFFVQVVLPVTGPEMTSCICISTVKGTTVEGQENWYSQLLELTHPDGKPFFNIFKFYLACDKCIREDKAAQCQHNLHELPWWQDPSKQLLLRNIMEKLNFADSAAQELQGIAKNNLKTVFPQKEVMKLFNPKITPLFSHSQMTEEPPIVFVSIDVSLGGDKSHTSLMSTFPYQGNIIIVGAESIPSKLTEDYREVIVRHVVQLRSIPKLYRSQVIICLENNTVGPARQVMIDLLSLNHEWIRIMEKTGNDITSSSLYEGVKQRQFGVRTQGQMGQGNQKEEMVYDLRASLISQQFKFSDQFFCLTPDLSTDDYKKSLQAQLLAFAVKIQVVESSFSKPKRTYDGKHAGPDDDAMCMMLNKFWLRQYLERPTFGT